MGKKSKRRTGKRSEKKETQEEESDIQNEMNSLTLDAGIESGRAPEYEREQELEERKDERKDMDFEEFMLWSLSDKADLTPKKFEKMAPRVAKMLITGVLSIQELLSMREESIFELDERRTQFELDTGIIFIMKEVNLKSKQEEDEFEQDLKAIVDRQKLYMVPPMNIYESFRTVAYEWKESRNAKFDECCYLKMEVSEFYDSFYNTIQYAFKNIESYEHRDGEIFHKYYFHSTARTQESKDELQKLLSSLLSLYLYIKECWECKKVCDQEIEKSLICANCKCATYCSRECQVKNWKQGNHEEDCKEIGQEWPTYESNKKRVGKALYRDQRVYTKPIIVNGIEKQCLLRPCKTFDYYLCTRSCGDTRASMNTFYKNIATLACGGKHLLFGNKTISSQLEEQIKTGSYEEVISDFDPESLNSNENISLISEMLQYKETDLNMKFSEHIVKNVGRDLSVDRFIILYICFDNFNDLCKHISGWDRKDLDKFKIERKFIKDLRMDY